MIRLTATIVVTTLIIILAVAVRAKHGAPLELLQRIPIPDLKDGDFDHFAVDLQHQRLFLNRGGKLGRRSFPSPHRQIDSYDLRRQDSTLDCLPGRFKKDSS